MEDHLRFAMIYWHTMVGKDSDSFGKDTATRPWDMADNKIDAAKKKVDAAFELMTKIDIEFFVFMMEI